MTEPGVQVTTAGTEEWKSLSRTLAAAFHDDPVFRWLIPDDVHRERRLRLLFAVEGRRIVLRHARSVVARRVGASTAEPVGAAFVLPPDRWRTPVSVEAACAATYVRVFGRRLPQALRVITGLEKLHLRDPHVYFPYIGVLPQAQGAGVGRTMVTSVLAGCDRDGVHAYLEASNPRCAVLYERLGFVGLQEVRPAGSPPILLMRRDPS